jgi:hypothetical protein
LRAFGARDSGLDCGMPTSGFGLDHLCQHAFICGYRDLACFSRFSANSA